jgi:ABC-type dipeptide/oligopeptide/nickel transport system ATPase component
MPTTPSSQEANTITSQNPAPILSINDLNIEFHDHLIPETVVYDFNLTLYPGEIVGIVGESGSGKSMCALAIAGLLRRQDMKKSGEILYGGHNLLNCPRHILRKYQGNEISIVFQEPMTALNPVKKIGWQIEETLRIHTNLTNAECYERAINMLSDVELPLPEHIYRQYPHELSGGMRQRVMIAMAMICEPKILIADEITTALDVIIQSQIIELLKRLNRERKTAILFISHDLSLVRQLCGKVVVLQGGRMVESGLTERIFQKPEAEYTKRLIASIPIVRVKDT